RASLVRIDRAGRSAGVDRDPQRVRVADRATHPHVPAAEVERDARVAAGHVDVCGCVSRRGECEEHDGRCYEKEVWAHAGKMDATGRPCKVGPTDAAPVIHKSNQCATLMRNVFAGWARNSRSRSSENAPDPSTGS